MKNRKQPGGYLYIGKVGDHEKLRSVPVINPIIYPDDIVPPDLPSMVNKRTTSYSEFYIKTLSQVMNKLGFDRRIIGRYIRVISRTLERKMAEKYKYVRGETLMFVRRSAPDRIETCLTFNIPNNE